MGLKLNLIGIAGKHKHLQIREINSDTNKYSRRVITPDMDVSGECQEIKDKAKAEWTDEVKSAYATHDREQTIKDFGRWID